jgi:hypothetical protein
VTTGIEQIGKGLIIIGAVLILLGGLVLISGRMPIIGRLPGDFLIQKKNFTFYFPLATSILISIIITFLLWLFVRR